MTRKTVITTAVLAAVGISVLAAGTSFARGPGWGYGHGPGWGMGYGPGMGFGPCQQTATLDKPLTVADVTKIFEGRMAFKRNPNVQLGEVKAKDDQTITVNIVTKDGSLVRQIEVDRATGRHFPVR